MEATASRHRIHRWTRQLHLWIGAWGAIAAIVYGLTGLVMNHRHTMKLPQGESRQQLPLRIHVPEAARADPQALADWLAREHGLKTLIQRNGSPGKSLKIGGKQAEQPERWSLSGGGVRNSWSVDYAQGDASLELTLSRQDWLAALNRLHKSGGAGTAGILLADSFALAMSLLGISGLVLWSRGRSLKAMAFSMFAASLLVLAIVWGPAFA